MWWDMIYWIQHLWLVCLATLPQRALYIIFYKNTGFTAHPETQDLSQSMSNDRNKKESTFFNIVLGEQKG